MYASLTTFLQAHPTAASLVAYYVVSAAVGSLPMPDATSHKFYRFVFSFANTLAANVTRAFASKLPATVEPVPPKT